MYDSYKEHLFNVLYFCLIDVQNIKKPFRLYCETVILNLYLKNDCKINMNVLYQGMLTNLRTVALYLVAALFSMKVMILEVRILKYQLKSITIWFNYNNILKKLMDNQAYVTFLLWRSTYTHLPPLARHMSGTLLIFLLISTPSLTTFYKHRLHSQQPTQISTNNTTHITMIKLQSMLIWDSHQNRRTQEHHRYQFKTAFSIQISLKTLHIFQLHHSQHLFLKIW